MNDVSKMIAQSEANKYAKSKKVISAVLAGVLSISCLGAGLAYLTDTDTTNQNISLAGWDTIDEDTVAEDIFKINMANLPEITNAMPGQQFNDSVLTVTNQDYSVDSSYVQVKTKVPVWKDANGTILPIHYNWNNEGWDISNIDTSSIADDGLSYIDVTATYKVAVDAGNATAPLFEGLVIDSSITRETLIELAGALGGEAKEILSSDAPDAVKAYAGIGAPYAKTISEVDEMLGMTSDESYSAGEYSYYWTFDDGSQIIASFAGDKSAILGDYASISIGGYASNAESVLSKYMKTQYSVNPFNMNFNATGVQATGFNDYTEAFSAL